MAKPHSYPPTKFVDTPSSYLRCPVCGELYDDPVINVRCGHTFCRKCVFTISSCPVDNSFCDATQLVINRLVTGQIEDLLVYCKYGLLLKGEEYVKDPSGCQEQISFGKRAEHESDCKYAIRPCPYNGDVCGNFRSMELENHFADCCYIPCKHSSKGCEFYGKMEEVKEHAETCGYRGARKTVDEKHFTEKTELLEERNRELTEQLQLLTQRVELLEESKGSLTSELEKMRSDMGTLQIKYEQIHSLVESVVSEASKKLSPTHVVRKSASSSNINSVKRKSGSMSPNSSLSLENWEMPFCFKCIGTLRGHTSAVACMQTYDTKVFTAGGDCLIKVWDLNSLAKGCIKTLEGHTKGILGMAVGNRLLYSGGEDLSIRVWNLDTYTEEKSLQNAHDNTIGAMVLAGDLLFTSSFSLIKVWDAKSLTLKHTMSVKSHWVRALALSSGKNRLFSGSHNNIHVWETSEPFSEIHTIEDNIGSVYSLAVTPEYIIAGTYNKNIQIYDVKTYASVNHLSGHVGTVNALIASPSGRFLFTGSKDSIIQIWNLENMLPIHSLYRHSSSVNSLTIQGDFLLSGSEDNEIKIYKHFKMQPGFAFTNT